MRRIPQEQNKGDKEYSLGLGKNYEGKMAGRIKIYDNAGNVVDVITTDENGVATSKQLELGTYKYKETNAPEYVVRDDAEYVFKLTQNDQVVVIEVVNTCKRAPITIVKNDEDGNLVEGITFEILDSNKNTVDKVKTDKNGVAKSKDLLPGTYYLRETKAPVQTRNAQSNKQKSRMQKKKQ